MKAFMRGTAVLLTTAATLFGAAAIAKDKTVLTTEREKVSYAIGMDVGGSIKPIGPDLDIAAFERAIQNAFDGGKPLLSEDEARATDQALRARIAARDGAAKPATAPPAVAKDKVGSLVGAFMVGPSLLPVKNEIELPVLVQAIRTTVAGGPTLLTNEEVKTVLTAFSQQMQSKMQAKAAAAAQVNSKEGADFLAKNKAVKGVFTTGSGLQYMVLRQGAGTRPKATDRVRVNYHGTLLDGTVFDSSYDRGQPTEFALNQVIAGWTEGVGMMPVGGKFRFWIPGELAYGPKGTPGGPIGPNATLVFDVELLAILD
ncbi:FKBP-type peptidyl-prolyl cis-trans isomerase [Lysobacter koreensis]|uniref:Peptidyl-prolyl cis-trans isomerase n=1 Tax=Lysobacter koreensis TaxID=266122 RepID=A0ABW2YML8_9GAMM